MWLKEQMLQMLRLTDMMPFLVQASSQSWENIKQRNLLTKTRRGKKSVGRLYSWALAFDDPQKLTVSPRQLHSIVDSVATRSHYRSHKLCLNVAQPGLQLLQASSFFSSYSEASARYVCSFTAKGTSSFYFTSTAKVGGSEGLIYILICHSAPLHV